jgi:hypothetical protein
MRRAAGTARRRTGPRDRRSGHASRPSARWLAPRPGGYPLPMKSLYKAVFERLSGGRPSTLRAAAGATAAGAATGVAVYRLLRHEPEDD